MDKNEWSYLRKTFGVPTAGGVTIFPTEHDFLSIRPDGVKEVWLQAAESVSIPFVFQTLKPAFSEIMPNDVEASTPLRVIHVSFIDNTTKRPVSLLDIHIEPQQWFPVDRNLRFFQAELEMVRESALYVPRKDLTFAQLENPTDPTYDSSQPDKVYVRASNNDVLCQIEVNLP